MVRGALWIGAELSQQADEGNLFALVAMVGGRKKSVTVQRALLAQDPRKLAGLIEGAGIGLVVAPNTAFDVAEYLADFYAINHDIPKKQAVAAFGWNEKKTAFTVGKVTIGSDSITLYSPENNSLTRIGDALKPAGSQELWLKTAAEFVTVSPAGALVMAAAVASPMLRVFGWPPIGTILPGLGGAGKTSILRAGASVFGATGDASSNQAGGLIGNGDATTMALLGQFMAMSDLPHLVDELKVSSDPRGRAELERTLHTLVDGAERARMRRDSKGTIGGRTSPGCAVVATETDVSEFLSKGGVIRRFLPIRGPYTTGVPLGSFKDVLVSNYGHAGRALLEALVASTTAQRAELAKQHGVELEAIRNAMSPAKQADETLSLIHISEPTRPY